MKILSSIFELSLCLTISGFAFAQLHAMAQNRGTERPSAVLVELFTSEGCSDCPAADQVLHDLNGRNTPEGQLIVGISEHVSYWNGLGWRDPFSADQYTERQNNYAARFHLESVYTPQMIVNGREQFVGSDRRALAAALHRAAPRKPVTLHITAVQMLDGKINFTYSAGDVPASGAELVAVLVDDEDHSRVLRGENSGRQLVHVSVARALAPLGRLHDTAQQSVSLPAPPSFSGSSASHHLVLFAQESSQGEVLGVDTKPI